MKSFKPVRVLNALFIFVLLANLITGILYREGNQPIIFIFHVHRHVRIQGTELNIL